MRRLVIVCVFVAACAAPALTPSPTPLPTLTPSPVPPGGYNCGGANTDPTASIGCTPTPAATLPPPGTELLEGAYYEAIGSLTVYIRVGPGWTHEQSANEFFDIEQDPGSPDVIAVQFAGIGDIGRLAEDVSNEIEAKDDLVVSPRSDVPLDCGLGAIRLTVEPRDTAGRSNTFWPVVNIAAGPLSIATGRRLQLDIFNYHMGTAIIMVGGSIAHWGEALAATDPVLRSVRLRPSGGAAC